MALLCTRISAALLTLAVAALPLGSLAQGAPSYAAPSADAQPNQPPADEQTIHGAVASFDGVDSLQINDDQGYVDSVQLQQGTIVNPSDLQFQPGTEVTIAGVPRGTVFVADRIDSDAQAPPPQAYQPQPAYPAQPPDGRPPMSEALGSVLTGVLDTTLDSKTAYVGEDVVLHDVSSSDGSIRGAKMLGTVTDVTPPGQGRAAQIRLHFDSLRLHDGSATVVDGDVVSIDVKTKSNAAKEAGGAFLGMLAGNAIAKTLFGVSGGGVLGAIGGYLIAKDNRADVVIPADTAVTVHVTDPHRRQAE